MKPVASLSFALKPSRRLLLIQSLAHLVAAGAVLAANLPAWLAAVLLLLTGASLARMRRPPAVASLALRGDGSIEIVGADGTASEAVVHPHTLVLSFLVVLLYRCQGRLRALTLLGDSLAEEDFRQLRLWLRWRPTVPHPA
jgi:toxin CptA